MTPKEWIVEIAEACDELGYAIAELTPGGITVYALDKVGTRVSVESVLLSGALLRRLLLPVDRQRAEK